MFWLILFAVTLLIAGVAFVFLLKGIHEFSFIKKLSDKHRLLSWIAACVPMALFVIWGIFDAVASIIAVIHLFVFWLLFWLVALAIRKVTKRKRTRNWEGVTAIIFTCCYLTYGWYMAHNVIETDYLVSSYGKIKTENFRIVEIADSHLGTTFDGDGFAEHIDSIQQVNPDIVVIVGDFIDDSSVRSEILKACEALGRLKTTYGVYYVFGNHDRGYYGNRNFTGDELVSELTKNNVAVLEDEIIRLDNGISIIGRKDKSDRNRKDIADLAIEVSGDYTIVLDHQPADYANEVAAEVSLVLSGHTHGGNMIPANIISTWTGLIDKVYGYERIQNTDFIVTSGISDWAIPFKTGTVAEFVVIDITK